MDEDRRDSTAALEASFAERAGGRRPSSRTEPVDVLGRRRSSAPCPVDEPKPSPRSAAAVRRPSRARAASRRRRRPAAAPARRPHRPAADGEGRARSCSWTTRPTSAGCWPSASPWRATRSSRRRIRTRGEEGRRAGQGADAVPARHRSRHAHVGRHLVPGRVRGGEAALEDEPAAARAAHGGALNPTLQARARQMGIARFVFKPGLSKLDPEQFEADLRAFASKLTRRPAAAASAAPAGRGAAGARAGRARPPRCRSRGGRRAGAHRDREEISHDFALLQRGWKSCAGRGRPRFCLVMRVAREFFERGILFLVKNAKLRGLGGFGPGAARREPRPARARGGDPAGGAVRLRARWSARRKPAPGSRRTGNGAILSARSGGSSPRGAP